MDIQRCIKHLYLAPHSSFKDLYVNLQKCNINIVQASVYPLANICMYVSVENYRPNAVTEDEEYS